MLRLNKTVGLGERWCVRLGERFSVNSVGKRRGDNVSESLRGMSEQLLVRLTKWIRSREMYSLVQ